MHLPYRARDVMAAVRLSPRSPPHRTPTTTAEMLSREPAA
jgi:hypothetical protein